MGKNRNQGKAFIPKNSIAYQNTQKKIYAKCYQSLTCGDQNF